MRQSRTQGREPQFLRLVDNPKYSLPPVVMTNGLGFPQVVPLSAGPASTRLKKGFFEFVEIPKHDRRHNHLFSVSDV